jgi:EAL domain-containing protein (putative c-di-GMP-specific phosphodiesterase class I)
MYQAKSAGRSTYAVHTDDLVPDRRERLELEGQLHAAIRRGELRVVYQPQVDLATSKLTGVEALVRWQHPTRGLLGPDQFVPLAEESGLIADIDAWVRTTALRQAREWQEEGLFLRMAVNLSTRELGSPDLANHINELIQQTRLDPSQIELEITDRVVITGDRLLAVLEPLAKLGVRIAIDDFGTGTSVLGRLQGCPIDTLKIDRSFLQEITDADGNAPVVTALLAMAHGLGLDVVAEGVETPDQEAFLRRHGCGLVQGFLFSRAVDAAAIRVLADKFGATNERPC